MNTMVPLDEFVTGSISASHDDRIMPANCYIGKTSKKRNGLFKPKERVLIWMAAAALTFIQYWVVNLIITNLSHLARTYG
jgi:hypothetical protein